MRLVATVCLTLLRRKARPWRAPHLPSYTERRLPVDWTQNFAQRAVGVQLFTQLQRRQLAIIYVGSSGRPFIRLRSGHQG